MWISPAEAIEIYARALRARHGAGARRVARERLEQLQARKDWEGAQVWERLVAELVRVEAKLAGSR